jgi:hypothetical protein
VTLGCSFTNLLQLFGAYFLLYECKSGWCGNLKVFFFNLSKSGSDSNNWLKHDLSVHNLEVSRVERINIGTFVSCVPRKRHDTRTFNNSSSGKHNGIFLISWLYLMRWAQNTIPRLIRTMLMLLTCISSWVLILNTPFITTLPCQCIMLLSLSPSLYNQRTAFQMRDMRKWEMQRDKIRVFVAADLNNVQLTLKSECYSF